MAKHSDKPGSSSRSSARRAASGVSEQGDSGLHLANHFLIAMPSMLDPVFGGSVVYMCEHNADGALGVIINKPTDMMMNTLFERIDLDLEIDAGLMRTSR
jgi:putative transcriptional regulator